jgi:hypothetical protein
VVLDTPESQLVRVVPRGADSLVWRAALLAQLMTTDEARASVAARLRLPPAELAVIDAALATPVAATTLPLAAASAAAVRPEPYLLTVHADPQLPLVSIEARAPDPAAAARLARAGALELGAAAPGADDPALQRYTVAAIGPPHVRAVATGQGRMRAIGAALAAFALWCAGVGLLSRLATGPATTATSPAM